MPSSTPQNDVQPFIDSLSHADWKIRDAAVQALMQLGETAEPLLIQAMEHPDDNVRREVANILVKMHWNPNSHAELMLYAYASQQWDVLINIGKPALPVLQIALQDENFYVRTSAVLALGEIGEGLKLLEYALCDPNTYVRNAAARALGDFGAPAILALSGALLDEDKGVRQAAATCLVQMQAVPALIDALIGSDWYLRREIAQALVKIGKAAVPSLIYLLQDANIAPEAAAILRELDIDPAQYGYDESAVVG